MPQAQTIDSASCRMRQYHSATHSIYVKYIPALSSSKGMFFCDIKQLFPINSSFYKKLFRFLKFSLDPTVAIGERIQTSTHQTMHEHSHHACACGAHLSSEKICGNHHEHILLTRFFISEMDCPAEESLIRSALSHLEGIDELSFDLLNRTLTVRHSEEAACLLENCLLALDLGAKKISAEHEKSHGDHAHDIPRKRLITAGVLALIAELGDAALHHRIDIADGMWNAEAFCGFSFGEMLVMLCAAISLLLCGASTYRKGWIALKKMHLNINALMFVAVTGAILIGQFPEAAMVMALFNISEALESLSFARTRRAIGKLMTLAPEKAIVLQHDGTWQETEARHIPVGSRVRVRPGEKIALDGIVAKGHSAVNQATITGESMPVEKGEGDPVFAGTLNEGGFLEYETTAPADESTLARIIRAVEEAREKQAPIQRFTDSFAHYYTPIIFLLATATAVIPPLCINGEWISSLYNGLVILVLGCPCALVISTPVSIVCGLMAASRKGLLIKGGLYLEQGRKISCIAFDKTGTLTCGKPQQTDFIPLDGADSAHVRSVAASLATLSDHPVSRALAENATRESIPLLHAENFNALPGEGVSGVINGRLWYLGNRRLAERVGLGSPFFEEAITVLEKQGKSITALFDDHAIYAIFGVADTVRESSRNAVKRLHRLGIRTVMLTGDNAHTAEMIAQRIGTDEFQSNLLPEEKLLAIEKLKQRGFCVGMVGDGINDAPALARADIGFALAKAGSDATIETADVALMDDNLQKLPQFICLSRTVFAVIMQNVIFSLGIKMLVFGLALAGCASMWMAVFADAGATIIVSLNGMRIAKK